MCMIREELVGVVELCRSAQEAQVRKVIFGKEVVVFIFDSEGSLRQAKVVMRQRSCGEGDLILLEV